MRLCSTIPSEMHTELEKIAKSRGESIASIVREAIRQYLAGGR